MQIAGLEIGLGYMHSIIKVTKNINTQNTEIRVYACTKRNPNQRSLQWRFRETQKSVHTADGEAMQPHLHLLDFLERVWTPSVERQTESEHSPQSQSLAVSRQHASVPSPHLKHPQLLSLASHTLKTHTHPDPKYYKKPSNSNSFIQCTN